MKKRLKGLIALIMAMAMVVSLAPSSFAAISDEKYEECGDYNNYMYAYSSLWETPEGKDFNPYYAQIVYVGEKAKEQFSEWELQYRHAELYQTVAWEIWGRTEDGGYDSSKIKKVDYDYQVTVEDIKEYGCIAPNESGYDVYYPPVLKTVYDSTDYSIDICDESGNTKNAIIANMHSIGKKLDIPEGYIGYILYSEYQPESGYGYEEEHSDRVAFVADYEDIWTEIEIMTCYGYEPVKLVPTTKIPYYFGQLHAFSQDESAFEDSIIYLSPGEDLSSNAEIKKRLKYYEHDDGNQIGDKEIDWSYWRVNYCGGTNSLNNEASFENGKALTVEQYTDSRKGLYTGGYSDDYYYRINFVGIWVYDLMYKTYDIPVYTLDNGYEGDAYVTKDDLTYYDWDTENYCPQEIWADVHSGDCGWKFEYDGVDYGEVNYWQDLWDIAIEDGNYDKSKAKLVIVCDEHNYVKDSVVEAPTVDKKGKSKYVCSVCGTYKIVEDIDKLIAIDSIELKGSLFTYTGSNIIPGFDVKAYVNSQLVTLTQGEDYTVSYSNNKMPGIATVTVTGKGKFAGTKTAQFTIKPAKVTNLKATPGINQITLSWNAVAGVTGYMVFASAEEGDFEYIGSTTKTSFVAAGLPNGTEYDYKVAAYIKTANGNIKGTYSDTIRDGAKIELKSIKLSKNSFAYTGEYIKPAVTVTAYDVTGREVTLTNNTDYKVEYKNFKNPGIATVTITGKGNYYGTLTATFTIKPNWVKSVKQVAASTYTKSLRIKWESVVGVTGYEVYKSDAKNGTYKLAGTTASTEFTSKNLEVGTSYYYKVRAYKTVNGKKIYGNFSNVLKATTKTVTPSKVMTSVASNKTNVKWYYSKGAAGYEVYMSTNPKYIGSKVAATTSAVRNVDLTNLEKGKTYYVRVRAYTKTASGQKMYTSFTNYVSFKAK